MSAEPFDDIEERGPVRAHFAADRADVETLRQLLAAGLSPDAEYDGTPVVWNGKTPLLTLCIAWHDDAGDRVGCFKLLRDAGANLEATDRLGRTPLHCAATAGKPDLLSLLIQAGVNVEAVDRYANATALHDAASSSERGVVDCVELLLAAGADMDARDTSGRRPFDIALTDNCPRLFPLFLRAGAEVPTTMITRLSVPVPVTDPYMERVRNAGGFKKYEQAHLARLTRSFEPKFPMLPKELVRHVVGFWLHAGYY
jgi:ankyrin repeat protein